MRVGVAGSGTLGTEILRRISESQHEVACLLLNGQRYASSYQRWRYTSFFAGARDSALVLANSLGVPHLWLDEMDTDALRPIAQLRLDLIITCGFGVILKPPILSLPSIGCVNVHSSLLPKHRGPMPFNWVILHGDAETGVTFHETTTGIDAGPIIDQCAVPLSKNDTAMSVYRKCSEAAGRRVVSVLDRIASAGFQGREQDESQATYDRKLVHEDMQIDWSRSAEEIDRLVRAGSLFLSAYFVHHGREVFVESVSIQEEPADAEPGTVIAMQPHVRVATNDGSIDIESASINAPVVWPWPTPIGGPNVGDVLGA